MSTNNTLTAVPGIRVGHATDPVGLTGCTVVLCEAGAVGGVDQRGGAPGTRETDLLRPMHLVQKVHGVMLAGGSAFGLAAADGVMRYLAERGIGVKAGPARVPIVPAAILFDLAVGSADARPDAAMGYAACLAVSDGAVAQGNVGAGTGCSAGKLLGARHATKTGIGSAAIELGGGLVVAALIAVNPFGDVVDEAGRIIAGTRPLRTGPPRGEGYADTLVLLRGMGGRLALRIAGATVIGVVATNARLDKEQVNKVAQMAQDGLARTIRPAHTLFDGDTLFALATGRVRASVTLVGAYAAEAVAQAIIAAARSAVAAGGLPAGTEGLG
jgi:L-aminopeptidase/D-esterase-like protein